ncbi:MAG TPA: zinc-ribbon domain-containing protein, partial [Herpetosiphonaceae bacterium]|nr:zinc-ribbon domain-containing protein [Herpetosiphonaceae bacterium]
MIGSNLRVCPNCGESLRATTLFCPQCGTAVMPTVSNALQISMAQILNGVKPGQAEVMRRCAIPRWF